MGAMPIRSYRCLKCNSEDLFFDHDIRDSKAVCKSCGHAEFKKLMSMPMDNKITENTKDYYTAAQKEKGIEDDLKKRSKKHVNDTIIEMHEDLKVRFGEKEAEKIMKENGFLVSADGGKTWRYRNDFDTGTLNAQNQGTFKQKLGK